MVCSFRSQIRHNRAVLKEMLARKGIPRYITTVAKNSNITLGSANITALGYTTPEVIMLNGFDFPGERLIFDWRALQFYAPIEDDADAAVNLAHHPELYPVIYGVKCKFTNGVELILPENQHSTTVTWFFPKTPNLWQPASAENQIYSVALAPDGTFPAKCLESLTLAYSGKHAILIDRIASVEPPPAVNSHILLL